MNRAESLQWLWAVLHLLLISWCGCFVFCRERLVNRTHPLRTEFVCFNFAHVFVDHIEVLRANIIGAMFAREGELSLDDVVFSNNRAFTKVGAAELDNLTFSIRRCTFESNSAEQVGSFLQMSESIFK